MNLVPRDPRCDNDDCERDGEGGWIHAEDCDAEDLPLPTPPTTARAGTFLAFLTKSGYPGAEATEVLCSYYTGGTVSPPDYCDTEAEPGDDYCTRHRQQTDKLEALVEATGTDA